MRTQSDEGVTGSRVECYPALEHRPGHSHIHTPTTDPGESQSRTMSLKNAFLTVPNEAASGETYLCTATGCQLLWDSSEFHGSGPGIFRGQQGLKVLFVHGRYFYPETIEFATRIETPLSPASPQTPGEPPNLRGILPSSRLLWPSLQPSLQPASLSSPPVQPACPGGSPWFPPHHEEAAEPTPSRTAAPGARGSQGSVDVSLWLPRSS